MNKTDTLPIGLDIDDCNAVITISGLHTPDGESISDNELVTAGSYSSASDGMRFSYMESVLTGLEGTRTDFYVTPDEVVLTRSGAVTSRMIFHVGQKHNFVYDTPFGVLGLRVDTIRIDNRLGDCGGSLEVTYDLCFEQKLSSRQVIHIEIVQKGGAE